MQKQIPIDSPIDNGTVDIIQSDPQFKRKNSLVYKGVLTNLTCQNGNGLLSTNGNPITWSNGTICANGTNFEVMSYNYNKICQNVQIQTSCCVLTATAFQDGVLIIEKLSDNSVAFSQYCYSGELRCSYQCYFGPYTCIKSAAIVSGITPDSANCICDSQVLLHVTDYCATNYACHKYDKIYGFWPLCPDDYRGLGPLDLPTCGDCITVGWKDHCHVTIGVEDKDMRNRSALAIQTTCCHCCGNDHYFSVTGNTRVCSVIMGFGMVSEDGTLITGEPMIVSVAHQRVASNDFGIYSCCAGFWTAYCCPSEWCFQNVAQNYSPALINFAAVDQMKSGSNYDCFTDSLRYTSFNIDNYSCTAKWNYHWCCYSCGGSKCVLANGVIYCTPFPIGCGTILVRQQYGGGSNFDANDVRACCFCGWCCCVANMGPSGDTNTSGPKWGTRLPYYFNNLLDFNMANNSSYCLAGNGQNGTYCYGNHHFRYVHSLRVCWSGSVSYIVPQSVPAMIPYGGMFSEDLGRNQQALARGTRISFLDFDNPIGCFGWTCCKLTQPSGQTQIFPHIKLFENMTMCRGVTYDYGRGWSRFTLASIIYQNYNNFGPMVWEEPLMLITVNGNCITCCPLDIIPARNSVPNTCCVTLGGNWNNPSSIDETQWYRVACSAGLSATPYISACAQLIARPHKLNENQLCSGSWYYSHNFTGINENSALNAFPMTLGCYCSPVEVTVPIYCGTKVTIALDNTNLFTPHSMEENYTINHCVRSCAGNNPGVGVTHWSAGKVQATTAYFSGPELKVRKVADYIYVTNQLGGCNVLIEDRSGHFKLATAFYPYAMAVSLNTVKCWNLAMPPDGASYLSNDVYYYGAGINSLIKECDISTSFLLPSLTINSYVKSDDTGMFTQNVLYGRDNVLCANLSFIYNNCCYASIPTGVCVQEFWTHSQATTDVSYKNSKFLTYRCTSPGYTGCVCVENTFEEDYRDTTWLPSSELVLYPIGITSITYGENYITSTVDVGDNYVSRFYNRDNQTFLSFNNTDQVYYGSEIFTIMSGNYYFDGQGIYYLGSQTDYSQNVFTAYAIGMKFLANSSAEAYFYSEWDKSLYIYTASNTLQKSVSLADRGNIKDALYSSSEQSLYILFDDNTLYIKSQEDDCLIENVEGDKLQSTSKGAFVLTNSNNSYVVYNPHLWSNKLPLLIESEWLGDSITLQKTSYVDVVLYRDDPKAISVDVEVRVLNGAEVKSTAKTFKIKKEDWKNQMYRARVVLTGNNKDVGNAVKVIVKGEDISIFNINLEMDVVAEQTSAPLSARY